MTFHDKRVDDVLNDLSTDMAKGLDSEEVKKRQEKYGANRLAEKKKKGFVSRFFDQFKDAMIIILLIAAAVSFAIACYELAIGEGDPKEFFEPALILLIVIALNLLRSA